MHKETGELRPWSEVENLPEDEQKNYIPIPDNVNIDELKEMSPDQRKQMVGRKGKNDNWPGCTEEFVKRTEKRRKNNKEAKKSRKRNRKK